MRMFERRSDVDRAVLAESGVRERRGQGGFTLVELMIGLAVAAILLVIALPSFRSITATNRLVTTANELVGAINVARMEAIKRNASVQFCSNSASANTSDTLGSGCGTNAAAVYALSAGAATPVRDSAPGLNEGAVKLNGDLVALRLSGQGLAMKAGTSSPYGGLVADICTSTISKDNHRKITMVGGSVLQVDTSSGTCP